MGHKLFHKLKPLVTDDAFFNRTEMERVGVVGLELVGVIGLELRLLLDGSTGFGAALLCKDKKEEGSARASPMAAPMPKSVHRWEKR